MHRQLKSSPNRKRVVVGLTLLLVVALVLVTLEVTNITHFFHHQVTPVSASQATKGEPTSTPPNSSPQATSNTSGQSNTKSNSGGSTPTTTLLDPSGNFVSNHHPNLGGTPAPNTLSSVCSTTPGASCKIMFTKGTVTKELSAQTIDAGGSTYWNWKLQDVGLTAGTWQIQAIATLGNQTKTTSDALNLEVAP